MFSLVQIHIGEVLLTRRSFRSSGDRRAGMQFSFFREARRISAAAATHRDDLCTRNAPSEPTRETGG